MSTTNSGPKIQILDGGMSRELMSLGAPFKQPEWSAQALIEAPEYVKQVHKSFVAAGADIVTTNSYALVPFHIGEDRFWQDGESLVQLSGKLARQVADEEYQHNGKQIIVAGSLPPIFGSYRPDLFDNKKVQRYLDVLVRGLAPYVDVWLGETLSLISEAEAVLLAVKDYPKPVWVSFTLEDEKEMADRSPRLRSGELVDYATHRMVVLGVNALLFNCSRPEYMEAAIKTAKKVLDESTGNFQLGVYANAFKPKPTNYAANEGVAETRQDLSPEAYEDFAKQWVNNGATIIGGCCGVGHTHIQGLTKALKSIDH